MTLMRRILERLGDERGFSLTELIVSITIGMVVMLAGNKLLSTSTRASTEIADRADASARARDGMEAITARLRSQVCLNDDGPAIVRTSPTSLDFFSVLGSTVPRPVIYGNTDPAQDAAQARRIEFRPGTSTEAGSIVEYVWDSPLPADNALTRYPEAATVFPALVNGLTPAPPYNVRPTAVKTLMTGVERPRAADGSLLPIFKFFKFQPGSPATPDQPVSAAAYVNDDGNPATNDGDDLARIVRIEVAFDVVAEAVGPNGRRKVLRREGERSGTDSTFTNEAYVRTADSGQPEESPECF